MQNKKGFTLVELLVVISVIGILVGMVIVVLNPDKQREKARDGVRMANMAKIAGALGIYYAEKGQYPSEINVLVDNEYIEGNFLVDIVPWGTSGSIFKMPPDENNSIQTYAYLNPSYRDRGVPILVFMRKNLDIIDDSDTSGLCWRPDREGSRVFVVSNYNTECTD